MLLEREPHVHVAAKLFALVDRERLEGSVCATTVTTIYYIAANDFGAKRACAQVRGLLDLFAVAPVGREVLDRALGIGLPDYEDAVVHEAARAANAAAIVTRDRRGFAGSAIPVIEPEELLAAVAAGAGAAQE